MKNLLRDQANSAGDTYNSNKNVVTFIEPRSGLKVSDFAELRQYRDLFYFLVWRNVKALYAQTVLGYLWALLQPLVQIVLFTVIFGKVVKVSTDSIPYFLYSTVAIIPWNYMSQAMSQSSLSLVTGQGMLEKIYFPRLLFPISPVLAKLIDFFLSILVLISVLVFYRVHPTWNLFFLPLFFLLMILIPTGVGLWLSALAIRFRDVRFAMQFGVRMLIYTAPILYSATSIPVKYRSVYSLNPIVAVIEGFRACLLGTPMPWFYIWPGVVTTVFLLISGTIYFKRMEYIFADVI